MPALMPNNVAALQQCQDNLVRLLLVVTQQIANPTQGSIDAVNAAYAAAVTAQNTSGLANVVIPKPNYSLDGESYQWDSYRQGLEKSIGDVQRLIVLLGGNYMTRSLGRA